MKFSGNLEDAQQHCAAGRFSEAEKTLREILGTTPDSVEARRLLARILAALGREREVPAVLEEAIRLCPEAADLRCQLGDALFSLGRFREAVPAYLASLGLNQRSGEAWGGLGNSYLELNEFAAATECLGHSLEHLPDNAPAQHNLAKSLFGLGCVEDAVTLFKEAARGGSMVPRKALAVAIAGDPGADDRQILETRQDWAEKALDGYPPRASWVGSDRNPERRLRIGYISSFFGKDNWMKPVWGLINQHDRMQFEIHLIGASPPGKPYSPREPDRFHSTERLDPRQIDTLIRSAHIDILIDLNGFSDMNLLPVVAMHPAPLLVGWFNMYAPSGISSYDYLIGDPEVVRPEEEQNYTERILRVAASYLCFEVSYPVPPVAAPPFPVNGFPTFGCLAPLYKITDAVVVAWAEILNQCPESHLLLKNIALRSAPNRLHLTERFEEQGIAAERLLLEGPADHFEFLQAYGRIDFALDTFPYNGGTTTMEAIWQGVPVIAFEGDRWASRISSSILRAGGLGEYVARDVPGYIDLAVRNTHEVDPRGLAEKRQSMREQLKASPVCDTRSFAREMEDIYRNIWRRWCGKPSAPAAATLKPVER